MPEVSISAGNNSFRENESTTITASLNHVSSEDIIITLALNDQTTEPEDYSISQNPITISAGSFSASTTIIGEEDNFYEGVETLEVSIHETSGGSVSTGDNLPVVLTISDVQTAPRVSLSISPATISENQTSTITASLTNPTFEDVIVTLSTSSGATQNEDFSLSASVIVIPAFSSSAFITLTGIDDDIYEGTETFTISILSVSGGAASENGTQQQTVVLTDNDNAPLVWLSASPLSIAENGASTLTVNLSNPTTQSVLVNLEATSTTADNNDYLLTATSITIAAGETSGTTTLEAISDNLFENNEEITVSITGVGGGGASADGIQEVVITIEDAQSMPTVSLAFSGTPFSENGGVASLIIELNHASYQPITVELSFSGTASTSDYTGRQTQVEIPPGSQSQSISITGVDDNEAEGEETIVVTIESVTNATEDGEQSATASISDDDVPGIKISLTDASTQTSENGGQDAFTVELNTRPASNVVLRISGLDQSEGSLSTDQLTFTSENWDEVQIVYVYGVDDNEEDGDITYTLLLSPISHLSDAAYRRLTAPVVVTNIDDDDAGFELTITNTHTQTNESGTRDMFTVVLLSKPTSNVVLEITGVDNSEGTLSTSELTFTPDNWNTSQSVTITGVDDSEVDGNINYFLTISVINDQSDATYHDQHQTLLVTNIDDDAAGILVSLQGEAILTEEAGTSDVFEVSLSSSPISNVEIVITGLDDSEATIDKTRLIFTPDNWSQPQIVTLTGVDDYLVDGDIDFTITLTVDNNTSDPDYHNLNEQIAATNTDDDTSGILITQSEEITQTSEIGDADSFTVQLNSRPLTNVTINISGLDTSEGVISNNQLIFSPDIWDSPQTVTITGVDDDEVDGNIDYTLTIAVIDEHSDPTYHGQSVDLTVTSIDDDSSGIVISMSGSEISTDESGTSANFDVMLSSQPTSDVVISISGMDDTEGELDISQLTFTRSNWGQPQTVTVTGKDDSLVDGDIKYTLTLAVNSDISDDTYRGISTSIDVVNSDNDVQEENHPPEAENDVFEIDNDEHLSGTSLLDNDSDPDGDVLSIDTTPLEPPQHGLLTIFTDGTFEYEPNTGFSGTDNFEYQVCDNRMPSLCASGIVTITVKQPGMDPVGDTDNDGIPDMQEGDGDCDGDGLPDWRDSDPCFEELQVTKGFSPNGDGYNDEFDLLWLGEYDRVGVVIFSRWGEVVYEKDPFDSPWDGKATSGFSKGKGLPAGTYYYIITIYDINKKLNGYFYIAR